MAFYNNVIAGAAGAGGADAYTIQRSLRFNKPDGAHLDRTPSSQGDRRKFTWSGWVKRNELDSSGEDCLFSAGNNPWFDINFRQDNLTCVTNAGVGGVGTRTEAVFRDVSAWYHVVCVVNTEESTADDRIKFWVNGVRQTTTANTGGYPAQNSDNIVNTTIAHRIGADGRVAGGGIRHANIQLAEIHFLDGIAISDPDGVFGEFNSTTGVWDPIEANITSPNDGTTWSSTLTATSAHSSGNPASYGFDGIPSASDPNTFLAGAGGDCVWNASSYGFTNVKVEVYVFGAGGSLRQWQVNGGTAINEATSAGWQNLGTYSTLSEIRCNGVGGGYGGAISAIRLNGITLVDGAKAHGKNGFHLDFSDNSSNSALGTDSSGNNNTWTVNNTSVQDYINYTNGTYTVVSGGSILYPDRAFNGSIQNYTIQNGIQSGTNEWTWTPTTPVTGITTLKLYLVRSDASGSASNFQYKINNGNYVDSGVAQNNDALVTISNPPSTLSKLSFKSVISNNSSGLGLSGVQVNGTYLANNDGTGNDSLIDSPTNYEADSGNNGGNYCTLNPLDRDRNNKITLANGNLEATGTSNQYGYVRGTLAPASGKFYYEALTNGAQGGAYGLVEATAPDQVSGSNPDYTIASAYRNYAYFYNSGFTVYIDNNLAYTGSAVSDGDVVGVAVDVDAGKVWFSHNGVWQGSGTQNPATGAGGYSPTNLKTACPYFQDGAGSNVPTGKFNFGQRSFSYTPPTNFKSFCTQNLVDPAVENPAKQFDIATWTGDSASSRTISTEHEPEMVLVKNRAVNGRSFYLYDALRGFGANKELVPNDTNEEGSNTHLTQNHGYVSGTTSSGFTLAAGATNSVYTNETNQTYAGWVWNGGEPTTNSAYNQDRVWSDGVTFSGTILEPATKAFDGNSATSAAPYDTSGGGGTPQYVQVTFNPGISYTSSVKVERQNGNPTNVTVSMNGGTAINSAFQAYTTVATGSGTLTSIKVQNNGSTNTAGISRIEVDGKVLVDKGVVPVGSLNSSLYDQSQTWSNDFTGPSGSLNYIGDMFDGNLATEVYASAHPATITWTPSGGLAYTSMRINARTQANHSNGVKYKIVGGSEVSIGTSTTATWYTLPANSTLEYVKIERPSGSNAAGLVAAVEKDGKLLVDATSTLTVPSHASSQRPNATAGFSLVQYLGANANISISHGLSQAPEFIIIKSRDSTQPWVVGHKNIGWTKYLHFNTNVAQTLSTVWQDTAPTSSVFTVGATGGVNANNENMLALCWHGVDGFSAFGGYTGTGANPGLFQFTGFKVRFLLLKSVTGGATNWYLYDTERDPSNVTDQNLLFNTTSLEGTTSNKFDFLSNGFIPRSTGTSSNVSGTEYIWAAWADNPLKYARAH